MHVAVLGAGVIGVTTAYYLSERGHSVTIVDRASDVASGASGGNGGQLSYSFTDAMASPALLGKMPRILAGLNPAFYMRPPISPDLIRWGLAFLNQCTTTKNQKNTLEILQLALHSGELMTELRDRTSVEFSHRRAGKLVMLDGPAGLEEAEQSCALKLEYGCDAHVITLEQAIEIEPALAKMTNNYAGAIYSESDEVGDPLAFTAGLGEWLSANRDIELRLNTAVRNIVVKNQKLVAIETDQGTLKADAVAVCLGAWSHRLLRPLGIKTNIYPMRGYSLTLPSIETSNSVSITDLTSKTVFSRLDDKVRIAGFADFVGYRTANDEARARTLLETARETAPDIADFTISPAAEWGGFRPMTADGLPMIGPSGVEGVYLNTGHGMLGWTLACVSGHKLASSVQEQ
jgi:D-amino-acid dehydrogenase